MRVGRGGRETAPFTRGALACPCVLGHAAGPFSRFMGTVPRRALGGSVVSPSLASGPQEVGDAHWLASGVCLLTGVGGRWARGPASVQSFSSSADFPGHALLFERWCGCKDQIRLWQRRKTNAAGRAWTLFPKYKLFFLFFVFLNFKPFSFVKTLFLEV